MSPSPELLLYSLAAFTLAGLVKGVLGLGLPTVLAALLALALPPAQAVALLLLPSFVTNLAQALAGGGLARLARRLWPLGAGIVAGTLLAGPLLAAWTGSGGTRIALGVALVLYAATALGGRLPALSPAAGRRLALPAGVATGLLSAASGIFVFPSAPYLQALGLGRADLAQALGLAFTVATVALAGSLAGGAGLAAADLAWSAAGVLPALAGMALGARLRDRLDPDLFRRLFLLALGATGLHLALA